LSACFLQWRQFADYIMGIPFATNCKTIIFIEIFMLDQSLNQCAELNRKHLKDNNNNLERIKDNNNFVSNK